MIRQCFIVLGWGLYINLWDHIKIIEYKAKLKMQIHIIFYARRLLIWVDDFIFFVEVEVEANFSASIDLALVSRVV